MGITAYRLANRHTGMPPTRVPQFLKGRRGVTEYTTRTIAERTSCIYRGNSCVPRLTAILKMEGTP